MTARELHWKAEGQDFTLRIEEMGGHGVLHFDSQAIPFAVHDRDAYGGWIELAGRIHRFYVYANRDEYSVWISGRTYRLKKAPKAGQLDQATVADSGEVRALMPGKVLRVDVTAGSTVQERQVVVIMESMKMETALVAPRAGTVRAVECAPGQVVEMGALLVVIE